MLISVGREIHIGKQCLIGAYLITDNPGHPIGDLGRRLSADLVRASECRPVHIGDYVWLATGTHVYPGCRIGDGVVALPGFALMTWVNAAHRDGDEDEDEHHDLDDEAWDDEA